jgi:ribosome modulation factor
MAYDRKQIVWKLRLLGARARSAGIPIEKCPYRYMDQFQWENGWQGNWGTVIDMTDEIQKRFPSLSTKEKLEAWLKEYSREAR